uniref:NADH dehydrogenase subunit 4L n=1 Tax=Thaumamermis cosgrovei TaxID=382538 RepID=Q1HBE5_THACS|nr:NADH dehydrogenase subunit 4L [Thaumamermis cosgrovei]ABF48136.1 NADH dehydrogenase subunit 4L [Thaumamermis cosgrovei]ABF48148.1 NADH dehydrogenase subunit 4L [Thaumamermis cosgrovei]
MKFLYISLALLINRLNQIIFSVICLEAMNIGLVILLSMATPMLLLIILSFQVMESLLVLTFLLKHISAISHNNGMLVLQ